MTPLSLWLHLMAGVLGEHSQSNMVQWGLSSGIHSPREGRSFTFFRAQEYIESKVCPDSDDENDEDCHGIEVSRTTTGREQFAVSFEIAESDETSTLIEGLSICSWKFIFVQSPVISALTECVSVPV